MMAKKSQGVDETAIQGQGQQPLDEHPRPRRARPAGVAVRTATAEAAPAPAADHQCTPTKIKKTGSNGDEKNIKGADGKPSYAGNFSKGLPHDTFGEVDRAAYKTLLHALDQETDFDKITLGLGRKLTNPQAGLATDPEGPDPKDLKILAAPKPRLRRGGRRGGGALLDGPAARRAVHGLRHQPGRRRRRRGALRRSRTSPAPRSAAR